LANGLIGAIVSHAGWDRNVTFNSCNKETAMVVLKYPANEEVTLDLLVDYRTLYFTEKIGLDKITITRNVYTFFPPAFAVGKIVRDPQGIHVGYSWSDSGAFPSRFNLEGSA
jgi:hypothetical protein